MLHRVTRSAPGPVDSTVADGQGKFTFRVTPDSGAVYLVSTRWDGLEYFGPPMVLDPDGDNADVLVTVSDTSSAASVHLAARHFIVSPPNGAGERDVVDLIVLDNPGTEARVSRDTSVATWRLLLPHFAFEIHGGNSDFSLESLRMNGDTVLLFAAIPPGQRDIELDYQIPPGTRRFVVPIDQSAPISNLVTQDRQVTVGPGFVRSDTVIDRKPYARWQGGLRAGVPIVVEFAREAPGWLVPGIVVVMASLLLFGTWRAMHLPR